MDQTLPAVVPPTSKPAKQGRNWDERQIRYQAWLSLPQELRVPSTKEAFARQILQLTPKTLWSWEHLPGFMEDVVQMAKATAGLNHVPEALHAHGRKAKDDVKSARLLFEATGVISRDTRPPAQSGPQVVIIADQRRVPGAIDAIAD